MSDLRIQEHSFPFRGRDYVLRCNFNVLAEVSERYGGELPDIFDAATRLRTVRDYLAAMLNDYARLQGWETVTPEELGRELTGAQAATMAAVLGLVLGALYEERKGEETGSKN